jgi:low temperature requirement protein LtrA
MTLLRTRTGHEARVGTVELFFDLVFVFAVTQLSHYLLAHLDPRGILETLVMFLGTWWLWIYTSWVTNWLDPERRRVRLLLFALMAAAMLLAMSIEEAWKARGLVFAGAYVFIQVGRTLFMAAALRGGPPALYRNFCRTLIWLVVSGIFWIAGGLAGPELRMPFWLVALAIEYFGPTLAFWVPGLGRTSTTDWDIEGHHMAERCGLFVIIALGESVIVTGATAAGLEWDAATIAGFASAFLGTVAMWWLYFNIGAVRAADTIAHSGDPGRYARLVYTYLHLPIVAGIIASAAADELTLSHPHAHLEPIQRALMIGGPVLFLIGNAMFKRASYRWYPLSHLIALAALSALAVFGAAFDALALSLGACAILLVTALWETISLAPGERRVDALVRRMRGLPDPTIESLSP